VPGALRPATRDCRLTKKRIDLDLASRTLPSCCWLTWLTRLTGSSSRSRSQSLKGKAQNHAPKLRYSVHQDRKLTIVLHAPKFSCRIVVNEVGRGHIIQLAAVRVQNTRNVKKHQILLRLFIIQVALWVCW
jgi:hypothetical protein